MDKIMEFLPFLIPLVIVQFALFGYRGEKHPCWHTILLAKSSVLYLLRPLTLERGCPTPDRHFSAAAEQADFAGCKLQKTRNLHQSSRA